MSDEGTQITIPARVTASGLAEAIGRNITEVLAVLAARDEPNSPGDIMDAEMSVSVARALGSTVTIEPRDLALERLYEADSRQPEEGAGPLPARVERMVGGVLASAESLDRDIEAASQHWAVARMPMIDRAILRLGLWELRNAPEIPTAVVVSEAVRLANMYSTGRSGSFVNGVLAALAKAERSD